MRVRVPLQLFCLWFVVVAPCHAQQLLTNSEFDSDVLGWLRPQPAQAQWDAEDVDGAPASGSAQLTNSEAVATSDAVLLRQCVVAPGPGEYRLSAKARLLAAQATSGSVVIRLGIHSNSADCSGGFVANGGAFVATVPADWESAQVIFDIVPTQLGLDPHASVEVAVRKTEAGGMLIAKVDQVRLDYTASLLVFADGFE